MRIAKQINSEMSVGSRLTLISGVFVTSTLFATGLFTQTSLSNIDFTAKERAGTDELGDIWTSIQTGNAPKNEDVIREDFAAGGALDEFLKASDAQTRIEAGRTLITAVADGSNLTLDPDLDTFYAMDAITVRLPTAKHRIFELQTLLNKGGTNPRQIVARELAFERMNLAVTEAQTSLKASIKNNKDGGAAKALYPAIASLSESAAQARNELEALAAAGDAA
jgi:methyl-accepting chemotaxis protein